MRPLFYLGCFLMLAAFGDVHYFAVKSGNQKYRAGDFSAAEKEYARARENSDSETARYNLGAALYQQKKYGEAAKLFGMAAESKTPLAQKSTIGLADAQNELGAELLKKGDTGSARKNLESAVAAYRKTLLAEPSKIEAKHNLEVALKRLEDLKEKEKEKEKQDQRQNRQDGQGKNSPQNGNDKPPGQGDNKEAHAKPGEGEQQPAPGGMTKEQADQVLANLARREEAANRNRRQQKMQEREAEKDW